MSIYYNSRILKMILWSLLVNLVITILVGLPWWVAYLLTSIFLYLKIIVWKHYRQLIGQELDIGCYPIEDLVPRTVEGSIEFRVIGVNLVVLLIVYSLLIFLGIIR